MESNKENITKNTGKSYIGCKVNERHVTNKGLYGDLGEGRKKKKVCRGEAGVADEAEQGNTTLISGNDPRRLPCFPHDKLTLPWHWLALGGTSLSSSLSRFS
ncbi:hypothetical protein E2C01_029978 [Portunus trituberculatus]|uniref:Uncharacterized protein n=1 Tax=Portunus trituberculatus TaxID=210409 RepID=A0A5B7ETM9_PORTR|nr:hypothetical protein [Portunus trituberculatus]